MLTSQVEIDPSISATLIPCVHDDPTGLSVCTRIGIEDECPVYNLYDYGKFELFLDNYDFGEVYYLLKNKIEMRSHKIKCLILLI